MPKTVQLIAPCGMNCGICMAYLRVKEKCPGCRGEDAQKKPTCVRCIIKNCQTIINSQSGFCYECDTYPCQRLKNLDKRYRAKYRMSMLENLAFIKEKGLVTFVEKEKERWRCKECGGVICVHRGTCSSCGAGILTRKSKVIHNAAGSDPATE